MSKSGSIFEYGQCMEFLPSCAEALVTLTMVHAARGEGGQKICSWVESPNSKFMLIQGIPQQPLHSQPQTTWRPMRCFNPHSREQCLILAQPCGISYHGERSPAYDDAMRTPLLASTRDLRAERALSPIPKSLRIGTQFGQA